jgi:Protein of unknown function (DUF3800)
VFPHWNCPIAAAGSCNHHLISAWGLQWKEVRLAFFTVYLDDSGTAYDQPIASASAWIIPTKNIVTLRSHWNRFIEANGITDFHASACAAPTSKERRYANLTSTQKKHIFARVRQFCKKYGVQTFGFSVHKPDFDSIVTNEYKPYLGSYYTWAVRHVVREAQLWKKEKRIVEPLQYIFDWQERGSDEREEITDVMAQMGELHGDGQSLAHDFQHRKQTPGLQCVDLVAWLTLQLGLNNFRNRPIEGLASECIKDFENYYPCGKVPVHKKWFQVPTVLKSPLKWWFENTGKQWFKDWYKRYPDREVLLNARKNRISKI